MIMELLASYIPLSNALALGIAFQLKTAVTGELLVVLKDWVYGSQGGMVLGWPRIGKSCGITWALKTLSNQLGFKIPFYKVGVRPDMENKPDVFYRYVLERLRHRKWNEGDADEKRSTLTKFLVSKAHSCPLKVVVLWFDEAQFLTKKQLTWIYTTQNEVQDDGVRVLILLSGSLQMRALVKKVEKWGLSEIIGRFMLTEFVYRGLQSAEELTAVLASSDTVMFPPNSGRTLASYFQQSSGVIPVAAEWAKPMWKAFDQIWKDCKEEGGLDLPMKSVAAALANLLQLSNADGVVTISDDMVTASAVQANLPGLLNARRVNSSQQGAASALH